LKALQLFAADGADKPVKINTSAPGEKNGAARKLRNTVARLSVQSSPSTSVLITP
jgi:hypothetical protein